MAAAGPVSIQDVDGKKLVKIRPEDPKYRVLLSIDGGGVRGIVPATILQGFEKCIKEVLIEKVPELKDVDEEDIIVDIADCFDGIAGNSAGSLIALYLASGGGKPELYGEGKLFGNLRPGSADAAVAAFDSLAVDIFKRPLRARIPGVNMFSGFFSTRYGSFGLEKALERVFGDMTLKDLKMSTYIPAYEVENSRPCGFWCRKRQPDMVAETGYAHLNRTRKVGKSKNRGGSRSRDMKSRKFESVLSVKMDPEEAQGEENPPPKLIPLTPHFPSFPADVPLRKVAQASASAPVFFPKTEFKKRDMGLPVGEGESENISWVDGGVVSNNPTLQALFFMGSTYADAGHRFLPARKMAVMSIGTGTRVQAPNIAKGGGQGIAGWGADLVSVLMDSHTELNHALVDDYFYGGVQTMEFDEPDRYIRINRVAEASDPAFEVLGALDSVALIGEMKKVAREVVEEEWDQMKEFITHILMAENPDKPQPATRSKSAFP